MLSFWLAYCLIRHTVDQVLLQQQQPKKQKQKNQPNKKTATQNNKPKKPPNHAAQSIHVKVPQLGTQKCSSFITEPFKEVDFF